MDLATVIGMIGVVVVLSIAMTLSGGLSIFFSLPALLIVFFGSFFVVMSRFGLGQFFRAGKVAAKAFIFKSEKPKETISEIMGLADEARKGGLLSLEERAVSSQFLREGIQLLIDGHDPDWVKSQLTKEKDMTVERHRTGEDIFRALGNVAPAMGLIGSLVGLVSMLSALDDPASIASSLALALLTTLYGLIFAYVIAFPIADKLNGRQREEDINKRLVIDALLAIQSGQSPRTISAMLRNYLPSSQRHND